MVRIMLYLALAAGLALFVSSVKAGDSITSNLSSKSDSSNACITSIKKTAVCLWGKPMDHIMIMPDMFSWHYTKNINSQKNYNNNPMLGVAYKSFFVSAFLNSYRRESFAFGLQRYWIYKTLVNDLTWNIGYRLGLMTGYQGTGLLPSITKNQPFLLAPQIMSDLTWRHIGWEVALGGGVVISTSMYLSF